MLYSCTHMATVGFKGLIQWSLGASQGQGQRSQDRGTSVISLKSLLFPRKWPDHRQTLTQCCLGQTSNTDKCNELHHH